MNKFRNFMAGRYGYDQLNLCIFILSCVFNVVYLFSRNLIFLLLDYVFLGYFIYRSFSKNIATRQSENYLYLNKTKGIRKRFAVIKNNYKDSTHKYYLCPSCHQMVRVPKGRGKIEINCPKCGNKFIKKS